MVGLSVDFFSGREKTRRTGLVMLSSVRFFFVRKSSLVQNVKSEKEGRLIILHYKLFFWTNFGKSRMVREKGCPSSTVVSFAGGVELRIDSSPSIKRGVKLIYMTVDF